MKDTAPVTNGLHALAAEWRAEADGTSDPIRRHHLIVSASELDAATSVVVRAIHRAFQVGWGRRLRTPE